MNWFKNLRIAYKISISCAILILMLVAVVFFSINSMRTIENTVRSYRENGVLPVINMDTLCKNLLMARVNMIDAYIAFSEGNQAEAEKQLNSSMQMRDGNLQILQSMKDRIITASEKALTEKYETQHAALSENFVKYAEAVKRGDKEAAVAGLDKWFEHFLLAKAALDELHAETISVWGGIITDEFGQMKRIMAYMLIIMAFSVVTGILMTAVLGRSISNPVRQGLDFARKIEEGDFTGRIDLAQKDELGMLANALNKAADKLEHMVSDIINSSNNLAQAVEQIASGNQNLSQRTSEQASALEEVAATVEEANSSINQNYENSLQASKMSDTSTEIAVSGGELVSEAVQSINEVNSSAKKISEITTVINEIAFQTNLLALNAAVEAARAGDQGRGFAVVAGEVRNLALRAGNAAKEIAQLINDTVAKVENGTEKTYKSGESLKEIIASVKKVALVVSEITAASNEQKQGVDQITTAITDLDSMTQHNAALVEETASASEEMANQAQELMALMSQFKIREGGIMAAPSVDLNSARKRIAVKHEAADGGNGKHEPAGGGNGKHVTSGGGNGKQVPAAALHAESSLVHHMQDEGYQEF